MKIKFRHKNNITLYYRLITISITLRKKFYFKPRYNLEKTASSDTIFIHWLFFQIWIDRIYTD